MARRGFFFLGDDMNGESATMERKTETYIHRNYPPATHVAAVPSTPNTSRKLVENPCKNCGNMQLEAINGLLCCKGCKVPRESPSAPVAEVKPNPIISGKNPTDAGNYVFPISQAEMAGAFVKKPNQIPIPKSEPPKPFEEPLPMVKAADFPAVIGPPKLPSSPVLSGKTAQRSQPKKAS